MTLLSHLPSLYDIAVAVKLFAIGAGGLFLILFLKAMRE